MKKKRLMESLNKYFAAEENAIHVPPAEELNAYGELQAPSEPPAREARRSVRSVRRVALIAACLAVALAVAVLLPAFIGKPKETREAVESTSGGPANGMTADTPPPAANGEEPASHGSTPEYLDASESDVKDEPDDGWGEESGSAFVTDEPDDGWGDGSGSALERYYPDELFYLLNLASIVPVEEVLAAAEKLLAENPYYANEQLPPLYLVIHELNISKEAFIRLNQRNKEQHTGDPVYTDEQIEWLFSDADVQAVQAGLKQDTTLLYNGRLYTLYELLGMEDSQLREMAGTEELSAYLADLDACLGRHGLVDELKYRLEGVS